MASKLARIFEQLQIQALARRSYIFRELTELLAHVLALVRTRALAAYRQNPELVVSLR